MPPLPHYLQVLGLIPRSRALKSVLSLQNSGHYTVSLRLSVMEKRVYTKLIQSASAATRSCEFRPKNDKRLGLTLVFTSVLLLGGCSKPAAETPQGVDVGDAKA